MVVKHCGTLIKAAGVPGVPRPESLVVKVVAKFVTQRAEKCPKRGNLLADRSSHPDADELGLGIIISEEPVAQPSSRLWSGRAARARI